MGEIYVERYYREVGRDKDTYYMQGDEIQRAIRTIKTKITFINLMMTYTHIHNPGVIEGEGKGRDWLRDFNLCTYGKN